MRTKNGKRIGPVPIALVAVFALAAFISAGFWLVPNSTQAQDTQTVKVFTVAAGTTLGPDGMDIEAGDAVEVDVGEAVTVSVADTFDDANDAVTFSVVWHDEDDDPPINVGNNFTGTDPGSSNVSNNEFILTPPLQLSDDGDPINRRATVTVGARVQGASSDAETFEFDVIVVQNPIEMDGVEYTPPTGLADGKCIVDIDGTTLTTREGEGDDDMPLQLTDTMLLVRAGDCLSSDDTIDVSFTNSTEATNANNGIRTHIVYVTGGDDLTGVEPALAEDGLDEHVVRLPAAFAGDDGEETISVSRDMADGSGIVYLIGYTGDIMAAQNVGDDHTTFGGNAAFAVKVVFTDPPVSEDDEGEDASNIAVKEVARGENKYSPTITVLDSNRHPVSGFVSLTVEGGEKVVFTDSNLKTHRAKLNSSGVTKPQVSGLPKTGPFRIKVTAEIGGLTLEKYIFRMGDADMVEATAYLCVEDKEEETTNDNDTPNDEDDDFPEVTVAKICDQEVAATKTKRTGDDPDQVVALGPGEVFFISAKAVDAAGNKVEDGTDLDWKVTTDDDNEADAKRTIEGTDRGRTDMPIEIAGSEDAVAGTYSITVTSDDGEADVMISVTVSDDASVVTLACDPAMVPTRTGETLCTATVTDTNGNVPSNLVSSGADRDKVTITVRDKDAQNPDSANFNAMGMATFTVLLGEDVEVGREITINVTAIIGDETLRQSTVVTYGEEMVVEPEPDMELGDAMNAMATVNDDGSVSLSWTAGANATRHYVAGARKNDDGSYDTSVNVFAAADSDSSHMVAAEDLASGNWVFTVIAGDADGWGSWATPFAEATVN